MNPFTKSLRARLRPGQLQEFIVDWDALEALVIRVFRSHSTRPADGGQGKPPVGAEAEQADAQLYAALRPKLTRAYIRLRELLDTHWRQAKLAGRLAEQDPFDILLAPETSAGFVGNWPAMQALPAAREAINRLVLAAGE